MHRSASCPVSRIPSVEDSPVPKASGCPRPQAEARAYVAAGGSVVEYGRRLTERQDAEIAIYERTKAELEKAREMLGRDAYLSLWEEKNDQLRNLGIRLVPLED